LSKNNMGGNISSDPKKQIESLYKARDEYTKGLFNKRYTAEVELTLKKSGSSAVEGGTIENKAGTQLAAASAENKDLKSQQKQAQATVIVNNTTNNVKQGDNKTVATGGPINDNPPYQQVM